MTSCKRCGLSCYWLVRRLRPCQDQAPTPPAFMQVSSQACGKHMAIHSTMNEVVSFCSTNIAVVMQMHGHASGTGAAHLLAVATNFGLQVVMAQEVSWCWLAQGCPASTRRGCLPERQGCCCWMRLLCCLCLFLYCPCLHAVMAQGSKAAKACSISMWHINQVNTSSGLPGAEMLTGVHALPVPTFSNGFRLPASPTSLRWLELPSNAGNIITYVWVHDQVRRLPGMQCSC